MTASAQRIEALEKRKQAINAKISAAQARIKDNERKDDTRLKVLVGAAFLADVVIHPETRGAIVATLQRAITAEKDREFLKLKGWL